MTSSRSRQKVTSRKKATPVWLALHTTDVPGAVAMAVGERHVSRTLDPEGQHARSLLGAIAQLLAEIEADASAIEGIVTTCGPGSFTGIRIGLATAQGLASARGQDVFVCDSLEAEAAAQQVAGWIAVVLDARRGEVFAALYRCDDLGIHAVVEPFVAEPQAASASLVRALPVDVEWQVTGGGAELLPLSDLEKSRCRFLTPASREDLVQAILSMAQEGQCRSVAPQELQPLYLRKSDAELNRQARFGTS